MTIEAVQNSLVDECSICLDEMDENGSVAEGLNRIETACHHFFHDICLNEWLQNHTSCPYCRAELIQDNQVDQEVRQNNPYLAPLNDSQGVVFKLLLNSGIINRNGDLQLLCIRANILRYLV